MRRTRQFEQFDKAMGAILRADPQQVKAEVDAEVRTRVKERKARGEHKRGRKAKKQPSALGPRFRRRGLVRRRSHLAGDFSIGEALSGHLR
jgi:hypothetical protein